MYSKLLYMIFLISVLALTGCQKDDKTNDQNVSDIAPVITTIKPQFGNFTTQIVATASVQPSPEGIVSITAPTIGTINKIHVAVGDRVTKNMSLLTIRSSDVSDVHSSEVAANAAYAQAKRTYTMNQELFKLGAITANDLAISLSNLQQAQAVQKGLSQKLNYYGASSDQSLVLKSPIDGIVYDIGTHLGEKVSTDASQPLLKIANTNKKIIVATVYEKDLSAFHVGKQVEIKVENQENAIHAAVSYISDVLDPDSKTIKVYIKPLENVESLRINMFVNVVVNTDVKNVYKIPKKSLLFKDGKFIVYVKNRSDFVPVNVQLVSDNTKDDFSLVKGIQENNQIAQEAMALEKE